MTTTFGSVAIAVWLLRARGARPADRSNGTTDSDPASDAIGTSAATKAVQGGVTDKQFLAVGH